MTLTRLISLNCFWWRIVWSFNILNFEQQYHRVNQILKFTNWKRNFDCLLNKILTKKNIVRELSDYITNKYNRFNIVWLEQSKNMRKIIPIEIIYKPVKNCNEVINCYFSNKINLAFRSAFSENGILRHGTAFQCHFCSNYYRRKDKYDRHLDSLQGNLGIFITLIHKV